MFTEIHCVAKGKVQRVGYRDHIERYASAHQLTGWIRNNNDDSVETVIQGVPDELRACIEVLNQGSPLARVESLAIDWRTPREQYNEFKVLSSR
jgi:acylphosphatase